MNMDTTRQLPLSGIKVIEFTHMVMGPAVGVTLADLGADVIKVEPLSGDATRNLKGSGAGYFTMYNRNKKSICLDLKSKDGKRIAMSLIESTDVMIENFRPGTIERLGLGYEELSQTNPGLILCHAKGFLSGPYEHRTALDEVTQMMGGLAYMTGPPGKPMRAGASVIDVAGGMFGTIGILAALEERHRTGKGQEIMTSLFETTAFLVGQHMAQCAVTGQPAPPMSVRQSAWAIYDIFETADHQQVFVGVVSDDQWQRFCAQFELKDLAQDTLLKTNADRVEARDRILPIVRTLFQSFDAKTLLDRLEQIGVPFAPIAKPEDLFEDPHLNASGGLVNLTTTNGRATKLPAIPLEMASRRFGVQVDTPQPGEHTIEILKSAGFSDDEIGRLTESGAVC